MSDRVLVQSSIPVVDVDLPDGTTQPGVAMTGNFLLGSGIKTISATPTITPSIAYAAGDAFGGLLTFADAANDLDHLSIEITDLTFSNRNDTQHPDFALVLFSASPSVVSADNAAFTIVDADQPLYLGHIYISGFLTYPAGSLAVRSRLGIKRVLTSVDLFGQLVVQQVITPSSATPVIVNLTMQGA